MYLSTLAPKYVNALYYVTIILRHNRLIPETEGHRGSLLPLSPHFSLVIPHFSLLPLFLSTSLPPSIPSSPPSFSLLSLTYPSSPSLIPSPISYFSSSLYSTSFPNFPPSSCALTITFPIAAPPHTHTHAHIGMLPQAADGGFCATPSVRLVDVVLCKHRAVIPGGRVGPCPPPPPQ